MSLDWPPPLEARGRRPYYPLESGAYLRSATCPPDRLTTDRCGENWERSETESRSSHRSRPYNNDEALVLRSRGCLDLRGTAAHRTDLWPSPTHGRARRAGFDGVRVCRVWTRVQESASKFTSRKKKPVISFSAELAKTCYNLNEQPAPTHALR